MKLSSTLWNQRRRGLRRGWISPHQIRGWTIVLTHLQVVDKVSNCEPARDDRNREHHVLERRHISGPMFVGDWGTVVVVVVTIIS